MIETAHSAVRCSKKGKLALATLYPAIAAAKSAHACDFIKSFADVHR